MSDCLCKNVLSKEEKIERVLELRNFLAGEKNLSQLRYDDAYLERFLQSTEFDVQKAFDRINLFYELLLEYPEWFTKDPPLFKKDIIEKEIRIALPETDKDGRPIYVVKIGNCDVNKMKLLDVVAVDDIWIESIFLNNPAAQRGLCVLFDISNYPWRMIKWLTPHNITLGVKKLQSVPFKEYRFHVVNDSMMVHAAIKLIWPFLPENIKQMVKFHFNDRESLYNYIDPEVLPTEYGGKNIKLNYTEIYDELFEQNSRIEESFKLYRTIRM